MKIADLKFSDLLPVFMRRDAFNKALAEAFSKPLRLLAEECLKLSTFDALDRLSAEELDALADELRVLWYDKAFSLEQKRALIAGSDKAYMRLGTKAAVQQVLTDIFGDAEIQEFFDYDEGKPHYFRIKVKSPSALNAENKAKLLQLLETVKRKSQWLDKIYCEIEALMHVRIGLHLTTFQTVKADLYVWQTHTETALGHWGAAHMENAKETISSTK